jgi:hypothetical protein
MSSGDEGLGVCCSLCDELVLTAVVDGETICLPCWARLRSGFLMAWGVVQ